MKDNSNWEKFLSPEVTRERLISASIYITAFEVLRESIIGRIRDFYSTGFDEEGPIIDPEYQSRVLSRNKSVLYASLRWLIEIGVVEENDIKVFDSLKIIRNTLAHELSSFVFGTKNLQLTEHFAAAVALLEKIETWWVVNVEIPINPDFDGQEINESEILPGPVLMLQLMLDVANGNSEYLKHYRAASQNQKP